MYLVKQQSQLPLGLSYPLAQTVCSFPHEESNLLPTFGALISKSPRHQGLPTPRRAVKKNPSWGADLETLKNFRVEKREDDHFLESTNVTFEATDGIKVNRLVNVHGVDVGQAGSDTDPIPEDSLRHVLRCKVHRQTLHPGLGHAFTFASPEPSLIRV